MTRIRIIPSRSAPPIPRGGDGEGAGRVSPSRGRRLFTPEGVLIGTTIAVGFGALLALYGIYSLVAQMAPPHAMPTNPPAHIGR